MENFIVYLLNSLFIGSVVLALGYFLYQYLLKVYSNSEKSVPKYFHALFKALAFILIFISISFPILSTGIGFFILGLIVLFFAVGTFLSVSKFSHKVIALIFVILSCFALLLLYALGKDIYGDW